MPLTYTDEQKAKVREIWAYRANRKPNETVRLLQSDEFAELELADLTSRTIRNWVFEEQWDDVANKHLYADSKSLRYLAQGELRLGAPEAARFLREAIRLCAENLMKPRYTKDGEVVVDEAGRPVMELDFNVLKAGITASQMTMDRAGFSPIGVRDISDMDAPPELQTDLVKSIGEITDEDALRRIEQSVRAEQGIGRSG